MEKFRSDTQRAADALFALELDRRMAEKGVHAYSVHPGVIMTDLSRHLVPADLEWMAARSRRAASAAEAADPGGDDGSAAGGDGSESGESSDDGSALDAFRFKSVEQGAATSVWAATAPGLDDHGGAAGRLGGLGLVASGLAFGGGLLGLVAGLRFRKHPAARPAAVSLHNGRL